MRIAIPLQETAAASGKTPRIAKKAHLSQTTSWVVTRTGEMGTNQYQELLHSLYDAVLITKPSGHIMDVNERAMNFLLYDKEEFRRLYISDIIIGANEQLLHTICRNIGNNRFTLIDAYCRRKDNTTFPAEIATNRLVLTKEGHLCFFVRDITKRKKAEAELIQTVSKLRELDGAKSRLISNVSHELRTPLTVINSFVTLIYDGMAGSVSGQQKECLSTVLRNCDRLANLIDDMLDLGRIESGREEFKRRRLDLPDLLRHCHHDLLPDFISRHQQFNLEIPDGDFPFVLGDADKIIQVVNNLAENANKFTPEGGEIGLALRMEGDLARVDVTDTGPGISPDDQKNIFEAFNQIGRAESNSGFKGTGLGLAICRQIAEAHDGTIKLQSETGKGCRFSIFLPFYDEQKGLAAFVGDRTRFIQARNYTPVVALVKSMVVGGVPVHKESSSKTDAETVSADSPETSAPLAENAGAAIRQRLPQIVSSALDCAAWHLFAIESEHAVLAVSDRDDLTKEEFLSRMQEEICDKMSGGEVSLHYSFFSPHTSLSPSQWLAEAKSLLEPLQVRCVAARARRVMLVDDDPAVLAMMRQFLEKIGDSMQIKSISSGYDACIHFGDWKPDLVILDLHLPDINGKKVFESMRKDETGRQIKFLAISGDQDDIREIMQFGCDDYLLKPFNFNCFADKVGKLLDR